MSAGDPFARTRRWAAPVGTLCIVVAAILIIVAPMTAAQPAMPSVLSMAAGFAIGIGYQFQPLLHRGSPRSGSNTVTTWTLAASAVTFVAAVVIAALGWTARPGGLGLLLLGISVMLLLIALTDRYPVGKTPRACS